MDEYGTYTDSSADLDELSIQLGQHGTIVFPYSTDRVSCYIVLISTSFKKLGIMPFGGDPDDRFYVGLYGKGCGHFRFKNESAGYIGEKLNIDSHAGEQLQRLFEGIGQRLPICD